jgi:large subunit ribosomal protein L31
MREGIHPKWYPAAKIVCLSCGTEWSIGSTRPELRVDICSNCHPFYTGEQRIVDTEGQVDRFMKRLEATGNKTTEAEAKAAASADIPVAQLDLGKNYTELLEKNGIKTASDFIKKLEEGGDDAILNIRGLGRKVLTDAKKRLRARGYTVPVSNN